MDALALPGNATSSVAVPAGLVTEPNVDLDDPMGSAPVTALLPIHAAEHSAGVQW